MVWRVGGHPRRKTDSREIEIITAWLQVGDRVQCAIYFSRGSRCRHGMSIQVTGGSKQEVEESRWPVGACPQRRRFSAGDEQPLSSVEPFSPAIDRDLGRARDLVEDA